MAVDEEKMIYTREIFEDLMDDAIWGQKQKKESKITLTLN